MGTETFPFHTVGLLISGCHNESFHALNCSGGWSNSKNLILFAPP